MRVRVLILAGVLLLCAFGATAVSAQSDDVFCVRTSERIDPSRLNRLVAQGRVRLEVVPASECAPSEVQAPTDPSTGTPWPTFTSRVLVTTDRGGPLFSQMAEAAESMDLVELERILGDLEALAVDELAWLDSNPPQACYGTLHAMWYEAMVELRSGAGTALAGLRELDVEKMIDGTEGIGRSGTITGEAAERIPEIRC